MSNHSRREADDLQVAAIAQFAGHGAEDAGTARILIFLVEEDHRIMIEADRAAVLAANRLLDAHDHALDNLAGLHIATGDRLLDAGDDDVAQSRGAALRAAEHLDAH